MLQIKNKSNKRITFPDISFSIGPHEEKEVCECLIDKVLSCQDIIKIVKEEIVTKKKNSFKTRRHYKT